MLEVSELLNESQLGPAFFSEAEMDGDFADVVDAAFADELECDFVAQGSESLGGFVGSAVECEESGHGIADVAGEGAGQECGDD